ncbi:MAG TPA: hypothetical protein VMK65_02925 [Longimicrobiales bacterium]|nr:hypothetical protein [Longimicrobiales bacterium]
MISDCYFCGAAFEPVDPMRPPARERVAYDPVLGRLWVVCPSCTRWSSVPMELRWEALEALERTVRDEGRVRVETANLSLVRVGGGELVRVGRAPRPELAGWRYGSRLAELPLRRGFVAWLLSLLGELPEPAPGGADFHGMPMPHVGAWLGSPFIGEAATLKAVFFHYPLAARCPACGGPLALRPWDFQNVRLVSGRHGPAAVAHCAMCEREVGVPLEQARPALRLGLAAVDRRRRSTPLAEAAGGEVERAGDAWSLVDALARADRAVGELAAPTRLALAMALDDQAEAEALESEWREAEELAAIADGELTEVPGFEEFRRRVAEEGT